MATWTVFYVKTDDQKRVVEQLTTLANITSITESPFPADHYNNYLMEGAEPDYLVVGATQPGWVTVNFNSFEHLEDWCTHISATFDTTVIVVMAQSVSDSYYFAYYDKGQKRREIEYCYSEDFEPVNRGINFDFEGEEPGIKEEDEDSYYFGFESIEAYCSHFGLQIQSDYDTLTWTILKGPRKGKLVTEFLAAYKKPWWKFW